MYLIKSVTFNFARRMVFISMIVIGTIKDILRIVLYPPSLALRLITKPFKRRRFKRYKPCHKRTYADEFMKRRYDDDFIVVDDNPGDKPGLNHKHDNYQSQIDGFHRKVNELLLNDEAYSKQFNRLERQVENLDSSEHTLAVLINDNVKDIKTKIESLEDKVKGCYNVTIDNQECIATIGDKIKSLKAKVDKILSENSELTFKPLTEEEEVEMSEGEAQWYKDGEEYYKRIAKDEYAEHKANYPDEPDFQAEKKAMDKQIADVKKRDEDWEALNPEDD